MTRDLINEFSAEDIRFAKKHPQYNVGDLGKIDSQLDEDEVALFINLMYWNRTTAGRARRTGMAVGNLVRAFGKAFSNMEGDIEDKTK